jgi:hypothetical protein
VLAVYQHWKLCTGKTRFSTETVCSTRTLWEQGVCVRRPGVDKFASRLQRLVVAAIGASCARLEAHRRRLCFGGRRASVRRARVLWLR